MCKNINPNKFYCFIIVLFIFVSITGCSIEEPTYSPIDNNETFKSYSKPESIYNEKSPQETTAPKIEHSSENFLLNTESSLTNSTSSNVDNIQYGILYDIKNRMVLWEKNTNNKVYPASLTKLLTAYTSLQYINIDTVFTVGTEQQLVQPNSSLCLIKEGHQLTLYDLICGMLMKSGNDAAYTIAVNTARLISNQEMTDAEAVYFFCELMNQTAKQIGMKDSNFCNPDGWDNPNHYTTVNDLLKLTLCIYSNDDIRSIVSQPEKHVIFESGQNITWKNTNLLLDHSNKYYYAYATGLKTGTTINAGKCLIATAKKNEREFVVITMNCDTDEQRYNFVIEMLNKAFNMEMR